jgi:protein tyrosine phosphatase
MQPKVKFKDWFEKNLKVGRFPVPSEVEKSEYEIYINVSDEHIHCNHIVAMRSNKFYYWFPMNEKTNDIGLNSIYGALQILYNAELENKKVFLHCHGGVNRSPTVMECYHYMRTGNFMELKNSRLMSNIESGHLPCLKHMKSFLTNAQRAFDINETMRGGEIDNIKLGFIYK